MNYDVITIGGGLAGSALAKSLAEAGARVLVLEREREFKDRIRGEQMHSWGVAEARALGIYELLVGTCAREVRYWLAQVAGGPPAPLRDLPATTPHGAGSLNFYHPEMQSVLLEAAERAGATVRRGADVVRVSPGMPPAVRVREGDVEGTHYARLVVGADGRNSGCRKWGGFEVRRDPGRMRVAGVLLEGLRAPEDVVSIYYNTELGQVSATAPIGKGRFRAYAGHHQRAGRRPWAAGRKAIPDFIAASIAAGAPAEWYGAAEVAGPLASFDAADAWVEHPYRHGVALVGDAAASSDPTFACGLSLTLRDVRVLRDHLLAGDDWDAAGHAYAAEHDRYYGSLHRLLDWLTKLLYEPGPEAAARRRRAFGRIAQDPGCRPDIVGLGPEFPSDADAYRRLFGEDPPRA